jgi:hypothetical protein
MATKPNKEVQSTEPGSASIENLQEQKLTLILNEIKKENIDVAQQQIFDVLNSSTANPDMAQWLQAVIYLKKNEKGKAIAILQILKNKDSGIGIETKRILEILSKQ